MKNKKNCQNKRERFFFSSEYLLSLEREWKGSVKSTVTGFWGLSALEFLDNLAELFWSGYAFRKSQEKEPRDYRSNLRWWK